jgi:hypothetical protein
LLIISELPSLEWSRAVLGERDRLTAWMSEDPDLVHSDVARMTLQRDRFKYHLQHTGAGVNFTEAIVNIHPRKLPSPHLFLSQLPIRTNQRGLMIGQHVMLAGDLNFQNTQKATL